MGIYMCWSHYTVPSMYEMHDTQEASLPLLPYFYSANIIRLLRKLRTSSCKLSNVIQET